MEILRGNYNNNNNKLTLKVGTIYFFTQYLLNMCYVPELCNFCAMLGIL